MKVGVYVAHDDDAILGPGGRLVQHRRAGDAVYIVIFLDGRNSHMRVLGIRENPTPLEVKEKRKEEMKEAADALDVGRYNLYFLDLEESVLNTNLAKVVEKVAKITETEKPDIVYFHHPNAHAAHRAVNTVVSEVLSRVEPKPEAYQFIIWTKELSEGRPEVDERRAPEVPAGAERIDIRKELSLKKEALFQMRSQVSTHPYPDWQVQKKPILDQKFINYFLRGEEVFLKWRNRIDAFKAGCLRAVSGWFALEEERFEGELKGNTLRVYWLLLRSKGGAVGVREAQRSLGFSSPALAAYHLNKLEELGLAVKERGDYRLVREVRVGVLKQFMKVGALMLPRYVLYATMFTTLLVFYLSRLGELNFYSVFALVFGVLGTGILWYETLRVWRQKP